MIALLALLGCGAPGACDFPADPATPDTVIDETDTCGSWAMAVGDHLVVDLHVLRELPDCALSLGDGLSVPNDPIYTNLTDEGPKYTYDLVAEAAADDATVDITCDEGTEWHALVTIQ